MSGRDYDPREYLDEEPPLNCACGHEDRVHTSSSGGGFHEPRWFMIECSVCRDECREEDWFRCSNCDARSTDEDDYYTGIDGHTYCTECPDEGRSVL